MLSVRFFPRWRKGWRLPFSEEDERCVQGTLYGDHGRPRMCGAHNNHIQSQVLLTIELQAM